MTPPPIPPHHPHPAEGDHGSTPGSTHSAERPPEPTLDPYWPVRQGQPTEADRAWLVAADAEAQAMRRRWRAVLR